MTTPARAEPLHDHGGVGDVRELELALVPVPPDARVVHVDRPAQRRHREAAAVRLPRHGGHGVQVAHRLGPGVLAAGAGVGDGGGRGAAQANNGAGKVLASRPQQMQLYETNK